jgi:hypothetical protein
LKETYNPLSLKNAEIYSLPLYELDSSYKQVFLAHILTEIGNKLENLGIDEFVVLNTEKMDIFYKSKRTKKALPILMIYIANGKITVKLKNRSKPAILDNACAETLLDINEAIIAYIKNHKVRRES